MEECINQFKIQFRNSLLEAIKKSHGSIEEFADEKNYDLRELKNFLEGDLDSVDQFLKLILDTNSSIKFTDHFDHKFYFPESFFQSGNLGGSTSRFQA